MKQHKHYDTIVAWARGEKIQCIRVGTGEWVDMPKGDAPGWYEDVQYRIKPKEYPKTTLTHEQQMDVIRDTPGAYWDSYHALCNAAIEEFITSGEMDKYIKENK